MRLGHPHLRVVGFKDHGFFSAKGWQFQVTLQAQAISDRFDLASGPFGLLGHIGQGRRNLAVFLPRPLQGCGKGSGGSIVALEVGAARAEFTVEETGHFQRFVPREVGVLELAAGDNTLTVRPVKKKGAAVMDLRRVTLERVE